MELLSPATGTIFWTAVTFVALLIILKKIAWIPILQSLEEREHSIAKSLREAEKVKQISATIIKEQGEIILEARQIAKETVDKAAEAAKVLRQELMEKAKLEAAGLIEKAQKDIERSKEKALEDIQNMAVELSMAATEKLIGKSLDEKEHKELIQEALKQVKN